MPTPFYGPAQPLLGPGGYPMPLSQLPSLASSPSALMGLPTNPIYNSVLNTSGPVQGVGRTVGMFGPEAIPGSLEAGASSVGRLSGLRNFFSPSAWKSAVPWAEDAGMAAKGAATLKMLGYPIAGNVAGNVIQSLAGGSKKTEANPLAEFLRGGAKGAGLGATLGAFGGPLAPVTSGIGAAAGGILGGVADLLDVGDWFGGKKGGGDSEIKKKANDALSTFNNILTQVTGADVTSRDFINRQLSLQQSLVESNPDITVKDKAAALAQIITAGQQMLAQYVQNPAAFAQQARQATMQANGGQPTGADQLAMQNVIASAIGPIANQIAQTGQQQADIYKEAGATVGGARGNALAQQGQMLNLGAQRVAQAYKAQAALLPAKYQYDQYGVMQPSMNSSPQYYTQPTQNGQGSTDPSTDALLAQLGSAQ